MALRDFFARTTDGTTEDSSLTLRVGRATSIGNYRDNNEDRIYIDMRTRLFMVADGMGGQSGGEQASQMSVEIIPQELGDMPMDLVDPEEIEKWLKSSVIAANEAIIAQGIADPRVKNMGTTVVFALLRGGKCYIAHVGDSRAYIIRNEEIHALTQDHNLAQALFQAGTIGEDELQSHRSSR